MKPDRLLGLWRTIASTTGALPARRWRAGIGIMSLIGLALLVVVAVSEALGWPFLVQPLNRWLSNQLERPVQLASVDAAASEGKTAFSIRFIGGVRLRSSQIEVGAPGWSTAGHTLRARDILLELRYADLWRAHRGQPLHVELLHAQQLDAQLERLADGRASWHLSPDAVPADTADRPALPSFGQVTLGAGTLRYRDEPLDIDVELRLSLSDAAAGSERLQMQASGTWRGQPLKAELHSPATPLTGADATRAALSLSLKASLGRAKLLFDGQAEDADLLGDLSGHFRLSGPSLAAVGDPLGVTLPTTAAFLSSGVLVKKGDTWYVRVDDATVGASRLNGAFRYDAARSVPLLSGRLGGSRLLLDDLGPVVGTATTAAVAIAVLPVSTQSPQAAPKPTRTQGKVLPDRPFDLASLREMDANVLIDIDHLDLGTRYLEALRPLRGHLQLRGGVLSLNDLQARTGEGRLSGSVGLDGRGAVAVWTAQLRWDDIRLERWIRQVRDDKVAPPFVSGRWSGQAQLRGDGVSTAQILGSLKGQVRSSVRGGSISHLVVEGAGIDLAEALGLLLQGDQSLPVTCAAAELSVEDGVLRPRVFVLDTPDSTAWIDGTLSLAGETIDLRVVTSPKDFSPLTLRTPLHVGGRLASPQLTLEMAPLGLKVGAALLLGLLNPLAALIPLLDPGNADEAQQGAADCLALSQRGKLKLSQAAIKR